MKKSVQSSLPINEDHSIYFLWLKETIALQYKLIQHQTGDCSGYDSPPFGVVGTHGLVAII